MLRMHQIHFFAGAPPWTPLGELMTLPRPPRWLVKAYLSPIPNPINAYGTTSTSL